MSKYYPFSAIVSQEAAKKALIYSVINPQIGGVLLVGEKGTAKSTLIRSFGELLLDKTLVELPINTTLDRLIGSVDIGNTVQTKQPKLSKGVLSKVHNNILYIDEVNLLSQGIVHPLIASWSNGETVVEREGFSCKYSSDFIVYGTMNPEEGGLTPDLLDRFGLYVEIKGIDDFGERKKVIKRYLDYEKDPVDFIHKYRIQNKNINNSILNAKKIVGHIVIEEPEYDFAVDLCKQANVTGHRADVVLLNTAIAVAAYDGRRKVVKEDIVEAAQLVLPHRLRERPKSQQMQAENNHEPHKPNHDEKQDGQAQQQINHSQNSDNVKEDTDHSIGGTKEISSYANTIYKIDFLDQLERDRKERLGTGRRSKTLSGAAKGRYIGFKLPSGNDYHDIAFDATIRTAALHQKNRGRVDGQFVIQPCDIRVKKREHKVGRTIFFAVDASGSMGARNRLTSTKNAILSLLFNAYQKRDKVAMIVFRKNTAELVLPITKSKDLAHKKLQKIVTGGRTPLALAIHKTRQLIASQRIKDKELYPLFVLITDGKANYSHKDLDPVKDALDEARTLRNTGIDAIVIDTENDYLSLGLAQDIASALNADYYPIEDINSQDILNVIQDKNCKKVIS